MGPGPLPHPALLKLLQEPELPAAYARAARQVLARKCAIYAQGCEKRNKPDEARFYRELGGRAGRTEVWNQGGIQASIPDRGPSASPSETWPIG